MEGEEKMKVVGLSSSIVGSKTRTVMNYLAEKITQDSPDVEFTLIDLKDFNIQFSDGRNYWEYEGDTRFVAETMMEADAIIIGTPIFQASIPATLKNIFDLLPPNAFLDKMIGIFVTAGTPKHFLVVEQQLKPILAFMKAQIAQSYVFIEDSDFYNKEIIDENVLFRLNRLIEEVLRKPIYQLAIV